MIERVIVFSAMQYRIANDATGELENEGTSIQYVSSDWLDSADRRGPMVFKESGPLALFDDLSVLPGVYDVRFVAGSASNGRGKSLRTQKPASARFVEEFALTDILDEERAVS